MKAELEIRVSVLATELQQTLTQEPIQIQGCWQRCLRERGHEAASQRIKNAMQAMHAITATVNYSEQV